MQHTTPTKRARIVQLRELNFSFREIGQELGIDHSTALRTFKKYHQSHDFYAKESKSGCPRMFTAQDQRLAARKIRSGAISDAAQLRREDFLHASGRTVR